MKNSSRFKGTTSHLWWEKLIEVTGDTTEKLLENRGKQIDSNKEIAIANAEAAKANLANTSKDNTMLYVGIGGVILVVLMFAFIAIKK